MGRVMSHLLLAALSTVMLFAGSDRLGPIGLFGLLAVPFPAAYVHMRHGGRIGGLTVAASSVLLLPIVSSAGSLQYLGLFGLGSFVLPFMLRRGTSWDRAWGTALLAEVICLLPFFGYWAARGEGTVSDQVRGFLGREVERSLEVYRAAEVPAEQLLELQKGAEFMLAVVPRLYSGLCVAALGLLLLTLVALLSRASRGHYSIAGTRFRQWKTPEPLVWVLISAGFCALVPLPQLQTVAYNLLVVLLPLYFLQGVAVIACVLARRGLPSFLRGVIYFLLVVLNPLPLLVTGVGLFDLWADFRRPKIRKA